MAAEYYACTFLEFKDMGLGEAADQVLKEGLRAYPGDGELLTLAKDRGIVEDKREGGPESPEGGLGQLLAAMMKSQEPSVKVRPELGTKHGLDFEGADFKDPELQGSDFWEKLKTRDLRSILLEHGGLIRVSDFLPQHKAHEAKETLHALQKSYWVESSSSAYEGELVESATHSFFRYDGDQLDNIVEHIRSMAPDDFPSFQAAMYQNGGNLCAHDDSNYFIVDKADRNQNQKFPAGSLLFRKIAVIYYLSKDWKTDYGGALVDMHEDKQYFPRFNSMVAFLVPRLHQVQELAPGSPPRFSLFGWFSDEKPYPTSEELARMPCFSTLA
ncbi:unnamed protein product [Durusdinium trenchii]|uniref:Gag-Pol-p199 (Gag-p45) (Pol-p20) (Pol-p63) (Pol-p71) (TY1A-TY1B) (Ty1 protease) (p190) (p23) (p54) (p60) (p84) (p90) n=2 Tax=Durusdinium trenchii TaxID=1381693 RepID=A0ABP0MTE3_9DINO